MTDPDYDPSIDSDIDPLELEIRKRVKLSFASVSEVAASAGLESFAHKLFEELSKFGYVYGRLYEMLRTRRKQYDTRITGVTGEWAEFYANGENGGWDWKADFPPKRGQPAHDTLLEMYQLLEIFWKCLPPPSTKKRRKKWSPRFERQEGITVPYNDMGILFLGVARLFDYDYSAANCGSVVDRVKNMRRSPASWANLRKRRRTHAARFQRKMVRSASLTSS